VVPKLTSSAEEQEQFDGSWTQEGSRRFLGFAFLTGFTGIYFGCRRPLDVLMNWSSAQRIAIAGREHAEEQWRWGAGKLGKLGLSLLQKIHREL